MLLLRCLQFLKIPIFGMDRNQKQIYSVNFTDSKPRLDGIIDGAWDKAEWSQDFIDIRGTEYPAPRYKTKVKMLYDNEFLYFAAELEEPHVWTTITEKNTVIVYIAYVVLAK